ncbi:hypothetical protein E3N88_27669 [Mikania micrantha]|uniref:DUF7815 domain-containing protein n=1 Tax=Mikania micrantha TaxID=192012 RepID=A0A5N6MXE9_9ASTR|nr:hypothetical protein E3N88_27669 [Mikania micrantha]
MGFKVPTDLIKRSQIGFRRDAGISSHKSALKSLPAVQNSLSDLESSPHCIRCKHCERKLLRGPSSLICIYCGQCQADDLRSQPIAFNSTNAYRLLLQSLDLKDSESFGSFFEEHRRYKGGTPVDEEITLAEHLDVRIAWRDEIEKPEYGFLNKTFDYINLLNLSGAENFGTDSDFGTDLERGSGSEASEQSVSIKNYEHDAFTDQDNLNSFQNDTHLEDSLPGDDAEFPFVNSMMQNEDSILNDKSSYLRGDSPSVSDVEVQSLNLRTQNEDFKTDVSMHSMMGDVKKIKSLTSTLQNEDFETTNFMTQNDDIKTVDVSSTLKVDSSSGDDAKGQYLFSDTQNEDSITNVDLRRDLSDSSSVDDLEIQSLNLKTQNDNNKMVNATYDLRGYSSSKNDAKVQLLIPRTENEDSKTNVLLSRDSSSIDEVEIQSFDFNTLSDEMNNVDPSLREHSSSEEDENMQSPTKNNESLKTTATILPGLNRSSSSGDDADIQLVSVHVLDQDSKSAATSSNLRSNSSSGDDIEFHLVNTRTHDEAFKTIDMSPDLSGDGSSRYDVPEIQYVNFRTQIKDSRATTSILTDLKRDSSSGDDTEVDDFKTTNVITSDLRSSSSSRDDKEIHQVNMRTHNEDSRTANVSPDLSDDGSSRHDEEIQSTNFMTYLEESKVTASIPTYLHRESKTKALTSFDIPSGDEAEIDHVNSRMHNEDIKTDFVPSYSRGTSSLGDVEETQYVNSTTHNDDSKFTVGLSLDFNRDSLSEDDNEIQNKSYKTVDNDDSSRHDAEIQPVNSMISNADAKTSIATSSYLNKESSSGDEIENLRT